MLLNMILKEIKKQGTHLPLLLLLVGMTLLVGCHSGPRSEDRIRRIVVFHSWSDRGEEGESFRKMMKEAFVEHGLRVRVHHIYMNMIHHTADDIDENYWPAYADSLKRWKPELIMVNDDPAFEWMTSGKHDVFRRLPVVFAGVSNLNTDILLDYMNITGLQDKIDVVTNCELIRDLMGEKAVVVALDNFEQDKAMRVDIEYQLAVYDSIFDNSDFLLDKFTTAEVDSTFGDRYKSALMMVSCQNPLLMVSPERRPKCIRDMKSMMKNAQDYTFLQVKYDVFSNILQDRSERPMFTCIREQFNNPEDIRVLGGYFTDTQTQVSEQVMYAAQILKGNDPIVMPVSSHGKSFTIDYNAISKMRGKGKGIDHVAGLEKMLVHGWGEYYTIVNTPFYLSNRRYWIGASMFTILVASGLLAWLVRMMRSKLRAYRDKLTEEVTSAFNLRRHILSDVDSFVWKIVHDSIEFQYDFVKQYSFPRRLTLSDFEKHIHPDYLEDWNRLKNYRTDLGRRRIRLQMEFRKGTGWHWYDIIYNVTTEASFYRELSGLGVCVDDVVQQKQQLEVAVNEAKEVELKQRFIANFRHVLKEPLQKVLDSARNIIRRGTDASEEQLERDNERLHEGARELIGNVDSLVAEIQQEQEKKSDGQKPDETKDTI